MVREASTGDTIRAHLKTTRDIAARLSDALVAHFEGDDVAVANFEDADGSWTVELYFAQAPDERALRDVVYEVAGEAASRALSLARVSARDWIATSLAGLHPVVAGRFVIHGAHDRAKVGANRIGVEIEAALAFGTGHHGTTRGCLLALDHILKARSPRCVLDVGTGTGVLAIATAKALHRHVLASDIDREAVIVARTNARVNCAASLVTIVHTRGLSRPHFQAPRFDLVFANILLGPLKSIAATMVRVLAPNAHVILSGLLSGQANAALAAYRAHGLTLERRITLDGWVTLVLTRRSPRLL